MTGYVYVIENESGLFKVGYTNDPARRLTMLRTSSAEKLRLLGVVPATMEQEKELHRLLSPWRAAREWFRPNIALLSLIQSLIPWSAPREREFAPTPAKADLKLTPALTEADVIEMIETGAAMIGIAPSTLCQRILTDGELYKHLKAGGSITVRNAGRIRSFLLEYLGETKQ